MGRISVLDMMIIVLCLTLCVWVFGFMSGYDVAIAQRDYIAFVDRCHEIANLIDRVGR